MNAFDYKVMKIWGYMLTGLLALMFSIPVMAAKVDPTPMLIHQSDGTTVTVIPHGDEFGCYHTTLDGGLVVIEEFAYVNGRRRHTPTVYVASISEDGELSSSNVLAHDKNHRTLKEKQLFAAQPRKLFYNTFQKKVDLQRTKALNPKSAGFDGYFPHFGSPHVLTILVDFPDTTFYWDNAKEIFDNYLNAEELDSKLADGTLANNNCSIKKYFDICSFGQYTPTFDVVGPIRLPESIEYYASGRDDNIPPLVRDAFSLLPEDVDLSQYDTNNDSNIDLVVFICAGFSSTGNSAYLNTTFWPKSTFVSQSVAQGKKVNRVVISTEKLLKPTSFPTPHVSGIGLFCHEFCHALGAPDLYATTTPSSKINQTMEFWDLMDGGEHTGNGLNPKALSAIEREQFGWMEIPELSEAGTHYLTPLNDEGGNAYKVTPDPSNPHHYYVLEDIQQRGLDKSVYGHGMLVTEVRYSSPSTTFNNLYYAEESGNDIIYRSGSQMTLVPADGFVPISYMLGEPIWDGDTIKSFTTQEYLLSHYYDPYPGAGKVREVLDQCTDITYNKTQNKYFYSTKPGYIGKPIFDIKENSEGIIRFIFDEDLTAVESLSTAYGQQSTVIYNLSGQKVGTDYKGIVIRNGKKILVR